ncbi:Thioredoxin H-type 2 [Morella rubra]|uniref:Thioredoxin H-type 2 n=1 Tax=Morella rubra TaxID=262757 RepID=A0A6A1UNQ0_9ROSI|nr:Thioredoxin H-type 2 [Morella rubra]
MGGQVIQVHSYQQWNQYMQQSCSCVCTPPVIVFFADRCCAASCTMEQTFANLASTYSTLTFLRVELQEQMGIVNANCLNQTPTFLFFKGGKRVDTVIGAIPAQLQQTVQRHSVCQIHQTPHISCPIRAVPTCPIHRGRAY